MGCPAGLPLTRPGLAARSRGTRRGMGNESAPPSGLGEGVTRPAAVSTVALSRTTGDWRMDKTHAANFTPSKIEVRATEDRHVLVRFDCPDLDALVPSVEVRFRLSPLEAQELARLLSLQAERASSANDPRHSQ